MLVRKFGYKKGKIRVCFDLYDEVESVKGYRSSVDS